VLGSLVVVGVELRGDALDRIGDAIERFRQIEIALGRRLGEMFLPDDQLVDDLVAVTRQLCALPPRRIVLVLFRLRGAKCSFVALGRLALRSSHGVESLAEREHSLETGTVGEAAHPHAVHRGRP